MRSLLFLAVMMMLTGCVSSVINGRKEKFSFISSPDGAAVYYKGEEVGKT